MELLSPSRINQHCLAVKWMPFFPEEAERSDNLLKGKLVKGMRKGSYSFRQNPSRKAKRFPDFSSGMYSKRSGFQTPCFLRLR